MDDEIRLPENFDIQAYLYKMRSKEFAAQIEASFAEWIRDTAAELQRTDR